LNSPVLFHQLLRALRHQRFQLGVQLAQFFVLFDQVAFLLVGTDRRAHREHDVLVEKGLFQEAVQIGIVDCTLDAAHVALPCQQDLDRVG
jgi:hypothetical protein